jgi:hypothetical protein
MTGDISGEKRRNEMEREELKEGYGQEMGIKWGEDWVGGWEVGDPATAEILEFVVRLLGQVGDWQLE